MNNVPKKLRKQWDANPAKLCARHADGNCDGRLTKEHTLTYANKQIQEDWAIIDLCEYHHGVGMYLDGGDLKKEKNVWIALNRATDDDLIRYSKAINYLRERSRLNDKYGVFAN